MDQLQALWLTELLLCQVKLPNQWQLSIIVHGVIVLQAGKDSNLFKSDIEIRDTLHSKNFHRFSTGPVLTDSWSTSTEKAQCSGRAAAYLWHGPGHAPGHVPWLWPGQWSWHRPAVRPRHWAWLTARGATLTSNPVWRCYMMSSVQFTSGLILAEIYWQKTNA